MKTCAILFVAVFGAALAQFPNGRILEPPVPTLCAQRVIHEKTPDGKSPAKNSFENNLEIIPNFKFIIKIPLDELVEVGDLKNLLEICN